MENIKKTINNTRIGEKYTEIKHKSGLTILLYPMEGYSSAYALFGTKLGSIDNNFRIKGEMEFTAVPDGVAHFLEHKMFENEEGDAFDLFAKTGASANAYTSFDRTCYLFSTTDKFKESLTALLGFVSTPYFTKETVEKEQGIIGQEIRMYDDNPDWRVFFNLLNALYVNHPVKTDIAGTVETIADIDDKVLYRIYDVFYNLSNMVLSVAGNFDPGEVISIADELLKEGKSIEIERKETEEPQTVAKQEISQSLEVSVPLFNIGFKETPEKGKALMKKEVATTILLEIIAGDGSKLYREMYDEGIINLSFGTNMMSGDGYFCSIFEGESRQPKEVEKRIKKAIKEFKKTGIDEGDFLRVQKLLYGKNVRGFNSVDNIANGLVNSHFSNETLYDMIETVAIITLDEVNKYLKEMFEETKSAISVILPTQN